MPNEDRQDETAEYTVVNQEGMQVEVVETVEAPVRAWIGAGGIVVNPRSMTVRTAMEAIMAGFRAEATHIVATGTRNEADPSAVGFLDPDRACEVPKTVWDAYHRAVVRHNERAYV